jgi:hypothetical protein
MGDLLKERLQSVGHSADPLEVLPVEHSTRISISHAPSMGASPYHGGKETDWSLVRRDRLLAGHVIAKHE